MKITKSKRFLAMLLSVLMVLTSLPIAAFTAFGAAAATEDPAVTEVKTAMQKYEQKLDKGTVYTNMSAAYQAYVDCQKALDAYQYGTTKNDDGSYKNDFTGALSGKADALNIAVNNMSEFVPYTGTAHGTFPNDADNASEAEYAENYKNILYSAPVTGTPVMFGENQAVTDPWRAIPLVGTLKPSTADTRIYMSADTVMLYDGITNPLTGVMMTTYGNDKPGGNWNNLAWYYCYVGTGQGLSMANSKWSGTDTCGDNAQDKLHLNYQWTIRQTSGSKTGACNASKLITEYEKGVHGRATANAIQFNREFSTLVYTINNPSFEYSLGISDRSDRKEFVGSSTDTVIRVLNYKLIMDTINNQKSYLPVVENYKYGGLSTVMQGFDQAMTDPNSFFTAGNNWQGAQTHYQTAINNLKSTATQDSEQYKLVRDAMVSAIVNTYNNGTNGWTLESWANFKAAYETAANAMSAPYTTGSYVAIDGQKIADDLIAAYAALESNKAYADTTAIMAVIQTFRTWENIFTADTYAFTAKYVDDAVIAIWGAEENFGIKTMGPEDTPEGNKLVADQLTLVNDAINHLRISPDAQISTSHGKYSLNRALAIVVDNPSQYFNYSEFTTAVENGNTYKSTLPVTELTDYTTQYNRYVEEVTKIVDAYYNLAFAFTDIPDGTVVQNSGFTKTQPMVASDNGKQSIAFGYTNSAVLIRTTHEAKALPYGTFSITFGTNISASNNRDKNDNKNTNNGLDSITLNATQQPISDNFLQARETGNTALTDRKVPKELSEEQKAAYPGLLEYNGFSVSNLRYTGKSANCDPLYYITDNDGNKVATTDEQARTIDLDPILGKTDGTNNGNVVKGSVYAYSSNSGFAYTYIDGDLNVNVEPSPAVELTRQTQPSSKNYRLTGNYIGAVTSYTCRNLVYCAGRCWFTTQTAGDAMDTSVSVVDLSYLIDLVKICDQIVPLKSKYTAESFAKFEQALYDAKSPYDYSKQSAGNIASEGSSRYTKLWSAYQNLVERPQILTFNYMDENGQPTSSTVEIAYNANIATVRSEIDAIVVPNYSLNGTSYTFKGWDPAVNNATVVTSDTVFTATYDSFATAYWGNYNASKDTLLNTLANGKFSAEGLNEVKAQVEELQYFLYTDNQKLMVSAANQTAIDAEKAAMDAINARLAEIALDSSTYDAIVKTIDTLNADAYDVAAVEAIISSIEAGTTVTIAGVDYTGWDFDNYVKTALEAMNNNAFKYTVLVYDINYVPYYVAADGKTLIKADEDENGPIVPVGAGQFKYGDLVTVQNPLTPGEPCKFDVTIIAENTQVQTTPKYVGTLTEYTFNVRGNTEIITDAGETNDYVISFIDGRTNTLVYTSYSSSASLTRNQVVALVNELPTVPFYTVSSLTNRVDGASLNMKAAWKLDTLVAPGTKTINITINYTPDKQEGFDIILLDVNGTEIHNAHYKWNQKVDLSATGAAGMIDTATGKLVAYGSNYSFYACQSITLQAVDSTDGKVAVSVADPVFANGKVYFTGSFAKEGFDRYTDKTVKGYGIVMDVLGSHANDLSLKDVSNGNYVFNLAASSLTCGNQFTVYSNEPSMTTPINYRAYVIYEVNGTEVIEYSDIITTEIG